MPVGLASGQALAVRPAGSVEAPYARVGPEDAFCGAGFAERLDRIFGCPCVRRGRPGQYAAFRPCTCGLSPGDGRTWRDADGLVLFVSRDTRVVAAGGRLRPVTGPSCAAAARARRATARRARAKLPRRNGEIPAKPGRSSSPPLNSHPKVSASTPGAWPGRWAWRAGGAPLKP